MGGGVRHSLDSKTLRRPGELRSLHIYDGTLRCRENTDQGKGWSQGSSLTRGSVLGVLPAPGPEGGRTTDLSPTRPSEPSSTLASSSHKNNPTAIHPRRVSTPVALRPSSHRHLSGRHPPRGRPDPLGVRRIRALSLSEVSGGRRKKSFKPGNLT